MAKKTWNEKFHVNRKPEVKRTDKAFADIPENALMLIATPSVVADYLKEVPEGRSVDIKTIRQDLALEYHAEYTCHLYLSCFFFFYVVTE